MALNGASILEGATISVTGGTAKTYAADGQTVNNGLHLSDLSVTDFRTRPGLSVKYIAPKLQSDGSYTKSKVEFSFVTPVIEASGKVVFDVLRISQECSVETSVATALERRKKGSQILLDSDFTPTWDTGSLL